MNGQDKPVVAQDTEVREEPIAPNLVGGLEKMVSVARDVEHKVDQLRFNLLGSVPQSDGREHKVKEAECFIEAVTLLNAEAQQRLGDADMVLDLLLHHFPDPNMKKG